MASESSGQIRVFFCYAHEDEALLERLKTHLIALQRQRLIEMWHDRNISAGTPWEHEIDRHLNSTDIIMLLGSPDFMASEYCYSIEMERAMQRHERGEARVIPVILRPVYFKGAPFGKLQALPTDAKPIISSHWQFPDEAFFVQQVPTSNGGKSPFLKLVAASKTDVGRIEERNDDLPYMRIDSFEEGDHGLFMVADGLRGRQIVQSLGECVDGYIASKLAVEAVSRSLNPFFKPLADQGMLRVIVDQTSKTEKASYSQTRDVKALLEEGIDQQFKSAIQKANKDICVMLNSIIVHKRVWPACSRQHCF